MIKKAFKEGFEEALEKQGVDIENVYKELMMPIHKGMSQFTSSPRLGRFLSGGLVGGLGGAAAGMAGTGLYNLFAQDPEEVERRRFWRNTLMGGLAGGAGLGLAETTGLTNPAYREPMRTPSGQEYVAPGTEAMPESIKEQMRQALSATGVAPAVGDPSGGIEQAIEKSRLDPGIAPGVLGETADAPDVGQIYLPPGGAGAGTIAHEIRHALDRPQLPGKIVEQYYTPDVSRPLELRGYGESIRASADPEQKIRNLAYTFENQPFQMPEDELRQAYQASQAALQPGGMPIANIDEAMRQAGYRAGLYTKDPLAWGATGLGVAGAGALGYGAGEALADNEEKERRARGYY